MFDIGSCRPLGTARCTFPVGPYILSFDITVVDSDVPILLPLHGTDRLGVAYDNFKTFSLTHQETLR